MVGRHLSLLDAEEDVALEDAPLPRLELGRLAGQVAHRHAGRPAIVEKQLLEPHVRRMEAIDAAADVLPLLDRHGGRAVQHRPVAHDQQRLPGRPAEPQPADADALAVGLAAVAASTMRSPPTASRRALAMVRTGPLRATFFACWPLQRSSPPALSDKNVPPGRRGTQYQQQEQDAAVFSHSLRFLGDFPNLLLIVPYR